MLKKHRFTMVELMIVVAIIGLVAAIAVPTLMKTKSALKPTSDVAMQAQQEETQRECVAQTGLPAIRNFQEKKMLKTLYELRDREDLICYAYLFNTMTGSVGQYLGQCIGYGLPASTQYSSPQKLVDVTDHHISSYQANDSAVIPQAEPNGLFMPDGLSATWLMMIDPKTKEPRPVYIEPMIIVSPFPLH